MWNALCNPIWYQDSQDFARHNSSTELGGKPRLFFSPLKFSDEKGIFLTKWVKKQVGRARWLLFLSLLLCSHRLRPEQVTLWTTSVYEIRINSLRFANKQDYVSSCSPTERGQTLQTIPNNCAFTVGGSVMMTPAWPLGQKNETCLWSGQWVAFTRRSSPYVTEEPLRQGAPREECWPSAEPLRVIRTTDTAVNEMRLNDLY